MSAPTAWVLAGTCLASCGALVVAEWKHLAHLRVAAKIAASLAFLALGLYARRPEHGAYGTWIVVGLALGVAGDIALLGKSNRAFLAGLVVFLGGHIAYVVAMATVLSPQDWLASASYLSVLPIAVALVALVKLWPHLGSMRVPVIAYVLVIVTMVIGAFALRRSHEVLAAGALLFFASDLSVARDKFIGASFTNKAWGLPAYNAAQLLIAWSLLG